MSWRRHLVYSKRKNVLLTGVKLMDHGAFVSFVDGDTVLFLQIGGYELDLPQFSKVVKQFGGLQKVARLFLWFLWLAI